MLQVDKINVYYEKIHAIKDVSFEVNPGEVVALIGANGAGKTTTLHTITGLIRPESGAITYTEEGASLDLAKMPPHKLVSKGLAHVPEGRRIFLQMTVLENLEMGAFSKGKVSKEDLDNVFARFPRLEERKKQVAGTLSGGEQQMLAMGRALMSHPKLLMLDEPSMGLSPILVEQIFDIIAELHKSGTTILLVEQNAEMALQIADRAYVLESGRVVMTGTGAELAASEEIRKAYLGG
ncbi:ABC transporter ATP-binding protein [Neglecta sp. X4]|jgi:branched-chain amino acid transport system ATP-binding protein|uniref:ABC transporter ATP-binding protein n=1 Tax=unclassified Neglectibacter TaxID=2632164 RepID=UPI0013688C24|nr:MULTISPECIES: ABC transporter ATP-binding protein [unclassified Neglectibacter]NBI16562.1 ABC transporter ATP-binding protein [Neglectibacter sp. 59]NBJ74096.1 ABC transporter ATP-binding protein [Neglectibacter sp. X4]NCE80285.1 ABC transporter ATP-binding protein [Neglectibacter sp. X58]